jgi:hypothetical protein
MSPSGRRLKVRTRGAKRHYPRPQRADGKSAAFNAMPLLPVTQQATRASPASWLYRWRVRFQDLLKRAQTTDMRRKADVRAQSHKVQNGPGRTRSRDTAPRGARQIKYPCYDLSASNKTSLLAELSAMPQRSKHQFGAVFIAWGRLHRTKSLPRTPVGSACRFGGELFSLRQQRWEGSQRF